MMAMGALLALFWLVAVPIVAFVALSRTGDLRREIADLRRQIAALLAAREVSAAPQEAAPVSPPEPVIKPEASAPAEAPEPVHPSVQPLPAPEPAALPLAPEEPPKGGTVAVEEQIGSRIFVWIGGIALALAGAFLVKYTIDAGLLGPGVRVILGLILGGALLAGGEFMRPRAGRIAQALSAAGIADLYASLFAAISLYHFVPSGPGFMLLAALTAGAIALSLRHGPFIGLVGLAGGFLTPWIVQSDEPSAAVLFIYLFLLQLGTHVLVRHRGWWWLSAVAIAGGMVWSLLWLGGSRPVDGIVWVGTFLIATALMTAWSVHRPSEAMPRAPLETAGWLGQGAVLLVMAALVVVDDHGAAGWLFFGVLSALHLLGARQWSRDEPLVAVAVGLTFLLLDTWHERIEIDPSFTSRYLAATIGLGGLFAIGGFAGLWKSRSPLRWAVLSAIATVGFFALAYLRLRDHGGLPPWGLVSLGLALLHLFAAGRVALHRADSMAYRDALGVFALAVTGFAALAIPLELRHAWIAVAWAVQLPAIAWIANRLDIPWLRQTAWVGAGLILVRLVPSPWFADFPWSDSPIFNWTLYGYGIPLLGFAAAAWLFRRRADDALVTALEASAIYCGVALVTLQIRQAFHPGQFDLAGLSLGEVSAQAIAWLVMGCGLLMLQRRADRKSLIWGARVVSVVGTGILLIGGVQVFNPLLGPVNVGEARLLNGLVPAYALPAVLLGILARMFENRGEQVMARIGGTLAIVIMLLFLSLEVRQWFQGAYLNQDAVGDAELYSYSVVWLIYGGLLLAAGIVTGRQALRYASLAVVLVAVADVFIINAIQLSGLYRVFSFLGLGLSLLAIGYAYHRFVFRPPSEAAKA
jgi:uncharacterized membrane protein